MMLIVERVVADVWPVGLVLGIGRCRVQFALALGECRRKVGVKND
jgi:hypothetical protein